MLAAQSKAAAHPHGPAAERVGPGEERGDVDGVEQRDVSSQLARDHLCCVQPPRALCEDVQVAVPDMPDVGEHATVDAVDGEVLDVEPL